MKKPSQLFNYNRYSPQTSHVPHAGYINSLTLVSSNISHSIITFWFGLVAIHTSSHICGGAGVEPLGSSEPNKIHQIFITLVCNIAN
jgi:hypothetical protein